MTEIHSEWKQFVNLTRMKLYFFKQVIQDNYLGPHLASSEMTFYQHCFWNCENMIFFPFIQKLLLIVYNISTGGKKDHWLTIDNW